MRILQPKAFVRLADALLDFRVPADLERWLASVDDRRLTEFDLENEREHGLRIGFAKGYRQGFRWGRQEGSARTLVRLLARRIGRVPRDLRTSIGSETVDVLDQLTEELLSFESPNDVWVSLTFAQTAAWHRRGYQLERCRPEFSSK